MGTNPLRKNRGNDTSRKLKSHIFYPFFPQSKSATIRIPLMSQYDLSRAKLSKAKLYSYNRRNRLFNTDLSDANLSDANFAKANLEGANLSRTNIEKAQSLNGTKLWGVTGLTEEQIEACKNKGAIVDEATMADARQPVVVSTTPQNANAQTPSAQTIPPTPVTKGSNTPVPQQNAAVPTPGSIPTQAVTPLATTDGSSAAPQQDSKS